MILDVGYRRLLRPVLFRAGDGDPERVHDATLAALHRVGESRTARTALAAVLGRHRQPVRVAGVDFPGRVGVAAGLDKNGLAVAAWSALGFGFAELGTVTPRPQPGNARPRLVRLPHDEALINRMGFNNRGADALAARIAAARPSLPSGFVVGVNIGRNRDGSVEDYPEAARAVGGVADYIAINVSSPNTPGLRQLQDPEQLRGILDAVAAAAPGTPLLVKLSPDVADEERGQLLERLAGSPAMGVIVSNTTVTRPVRSRQLAQEDGGLSGHPLLPRTIAAVEQAAGRGLAVIGSGGVASAADARALVEAGADLVQLWTGMVYAGPGLIGETVRR